MSCSGPARLGGATSCRYLAPRLLSSSQRESPDPLLVVQSQWFGLGIGPSEFPMECRTLPSHPWSLKSLCPLQACTSVGPQGARALKKVTNLPDPPPGTRPFSKMLMRFSRNASWKQDGIIVIAPAVNLWDNKSVFNSTSSTPYPVVWPDGARTAMGSTTRPSGGIDASASGQYSELLLMLGSATNAKIWIRTRLPWHSDCMILSKTERPPVPVIVFCWLMEMGLQCFTTVSTVKWQAMQTTLFLCYWRSWAIMFKFNSMYIYTCTTACIPLTIYIYILHQFI